VSAPISEPAFAPLAVPEGRTAFADALLRALRDPLGALGATLVVLFVLSAALAPLIAPYDPNALDVPARLQGPSLAHLLGTDNLGRDVLSRVLYGGRIALGVALTAVGLSLVAGILLGLVAGYGPRWLDNLLLLLCDSVRAFPVIMFALAVITVVGPSLQTVILVVVVTTIPAYARIVRTQTLSLRHTEFILAERSLGAGAPRVLLVHILPNVIGPLLILASMEIPVVITVEAGLSFLGLGVRPPTPSWGNILNDGYAFIRNTPWLVIAAGIPLVLSTLGFTFLGETLRDVFDPRLRRD
jgi:peptide/nickel transport system permease protein